MPLFVCDRCGCVENTSTGRFWSKDNPNIWSDDNLGLALCSECEPTTYIDGSVNKDGGKWHGRFKKRLATEEEIKEGKFINR